MDAVTAPYRKPGAPSLVKKMVFPWEKDMPETAETDLQQLEKVVQENNIKFWGEYDKRKIEA